MSFIHILDFFYDYEVFFKLFSHKEFHMHSSISTLIYVQLDLYLLRFRYISLYVYSIYPNINSLGLL